MQTIKYGNLVLVPCRGAHCGGSYVKQTDPDHICSACNRQLGRVRRVLYQEPTTTVTPPKRKRHSSVIAIESDSESDTDIDDGENNSPPPAPKKAKAKQPSPALQSFMSHVASGVAVERLPRSCKPGCVCQCCRGVCRSKCCL